MNNLNDLFHHFNVKNILIPLSLLGFIFITVNYFIIPTHTSQVSVYFLDSVHKHTRRWMGGVKEISPATWSAHILIEGKNVVCDIPNSLYSTLKNLSDNNRFAVLHYHYAIFSDDIVCEQLDASSIKNITTQ